MWFWCHCKKEWAPILPFGLLWDGCINYKHKIQRIEILTMVKSRNIQEWETKWGMTLVLEGRHVNLKVLKDTHEQREELRGASCYPMTPSEGHKEWQRGGREGWGRGNEVKEEHFRIQTLENAKMFAIRKPMGCSHQWTGKMKQKCQDLEGMQQRNCVMDKTEFTKEGSTVWIARQSHWPGAQIPKVDEKMYKTVTWPW